MSDHLEEGETKDHVTEYTDSALFSVEADRDPKGKLDDWVIGCKDDCF